MTPHVVECCRALVEAGISVTPTPSGVKLKSYGSPASPELVASVARVKDAFRSALIDESIRELWPSLPAGTLPPSWRPLLVWYGAERATFTVDELELYTERTGVLEHDAGAPRWLAEVLAVEEIMNAGPRSLSPLLRAA